MHPQERHQLRKLINEWYRLICEGKPGAAVAAKKLTILAVAPPGRYAELALQALREAGLGAHDEARTDKPTAARKK